MSFVVITAEFPEISALAFEDIFRKLEATNWKQLHFYTQAKKSSWFNMTVPEQPEEALKAARHSFTACCIPYCLPRLSLEWSSYNEQNSPLQ